MRLLVVADLHGAYQQLAALLRPDDVLISLGDHVNVIDYKDLSGLLADFVPPETIDATLRLIKEGRLEEARAAMARAAGSVPNLFARIKQAAREAYFELSESIPCEAHFIYGNVDFPDVLRASLKENQTLHEADAIEFEGRRFGLVSGHPPGPYSFGMPGEVDRQTFAQRLHAIGGCDVICVHPPPAIEGLTYDVGANRDEEGSADLLYYADLVRPRLVLFGHIHQPRVPEFTDRKSSSLPVRFINVGCFRDTGRLLQLHLPDLETTWLTADSPPA
jgi:Icc-related predicted phosphoesterase